MMKKLGRFLSYILVAALASAVTLCFTVEEATPTAQKLAQLEQILTEKYIGEADPVVMADAAADAMVTAMGDRWSYYVAASDYQAYEEQKNNAYVGVGMTIQLTEDDSGILVINVTEGGPAQEAGVLAGDVLIAVEGESIIGWTADEVKNVVKGEEGTYVNLTFKRGGEEVTLSVQRRTVNTPVATGKLLDNGVGLVTIVNFDARCSEESIAAMDSLLEQGAKALIFDVRFNPGGYAHELVKVLDHILPEGDLFRTVDYQGNENVDTSDADCLTGIPMAVLVNGDSYSAAEFFAAALREYDYAVVVGEQTVGKGYFQRSYMLDDGSAVALSVGKYYTPKGVNLNEAGGITPDVEVSVTEDEAFGIYAGTLDPMEDPQVLAALKALGY